MATSSLWKINESRVLIRLSTSFVVLKTENDDLPIKTPHNQAVRSPDPFSGSHALALIVIHKSQATNVGWVER
jgi:hypothetical protein